MPPREVPTDSFYSADGSTPETPMQALMEAPPGAEPAVSAIEKTHSLSAVIGELMSELLNEDELDMVTMHVGGFSVREIADMVGLPKSTVHRQLPKLMQRVAAAFKNNEEILGHVYGITDEGTDPQGG